MSKFNELLDYADIIYEKYTEIYNMSINKEINKEKIMRAVEELRMLVKLESSLYQTINLNEISSLYEELSCVSEYIEFNDEDEEEIEYIEDYPVELALDLTGIDKIRKYDRIESKLDMVWDRVYDNESLYPSYRGVPLLDMDESKNIIRHIQIINYTLSYLTIKSILKDEELTSELKYKYMYDLSVTDSYIENTLLSYKFNIDKLDEEKYIEYINMLKVKPDFAQSIRDTFTNEFMYYIKEILEFTEYDDLEMYEEVYKKDLHIINAYCKIYDNEFLKEIKIFINRAFEFLVKKNHKGFESVIDVITDNINEKKLNKTKK